jgi:hypothetical protein
MRGRTPCQQDKPREYAGRRHNPSRTPRPSVAVAAIRGIRSSRSERTRHARLAELKTPIDVMHQVGHRFLVVT